MSKNVLIISGSPRKDGNSDLLCNYFAEGAHEAGHKVTKVSLRDKKIGFCHACYQCRQTQKCFQADDMAEILDKIIAADVLVLASPVYFYSVDAQIKAMIDRTLPRWTEIRDKELYYIVTAADSNPAALERTVECFRGFADCFSSMTERGVLYGHSVYEKGAVKNTDYPAQAKEMGICGGGGYTLKTVQTDKRLKAAATLSMFNSGIVRKNGYMNSAPDAAIKNLETASAIRAAEATGAEIHRTPGMETMEIPQEKPAEMPTLYSEGYIYYGKTHRHPNSTFQYTLRSNLDLFTFDAAANMELINQPLLMIAGSEADSLYMTEDAFAKATGTSSKELFLVEGATHIQTYWIPEYVDKIAAKLADFYGKNL